jgi:hypothetical protein
MGCMGHTSPKTKLRHIMLKIVKAYGNLLLLHNKAQCLNKNNHLKTPSLNLQSSGQHLQDAALFDPML